MITVTLIPLKYRAPSRTTRTKNSTNGTKQILLFPSRFGKDDWWMKMGTAKFEGCPVSDCHVTNDRNHLDSIAEFDAILFHYRQ